MGLIPGVLSPTPPPMESDTAGAAFGLEGPASSMFDSAARRPSWQSTGGADADRFAGDAGAAAAAAGAPVAAAPPVASNLSAASDTVLVSAPAQAVAASTVSKPR